MSAYSCKPILPYDPNNRNYMYSYLMNNVANVMRKDNDLGIDRRNSLLIESKIPSFLCGGTSSCMNQYPSVFIPRLRICGKNDCLSSTSNLSSFLIRYLNIAHTGLGRSRMNFLRNTVVFLPHKYEFLSIKIRSPVE